MQLWRLSRHESLSGEGGRRYGARWHCPGSPIVYLAESPPGALIEILVHLELDESELPSAYRLLRVTAPDKLRTSQLRVPSGDAWKSNLLLTRRIGDEWLTSER